MNNSLIKKALEVNGDSSYLINNTEKYYLSMKLGSFPSICGAGIFSGFDFCWDKIKQLSGGDEFEMLRYVGYAIYLSNNLFNKSGVFVAGFAAPTNKTYKREAIWAPEIQKCLDYFAELQWMSPVYENKFGAANKTGGDWQLAVYKLRGFLPKKDDPDYCKL